jgi:cell division protein YceG involved in septum cleavage
MSSKEKKKNLWVKLYIIILFFCGIAIWFCVQPIKKQEISVDISIEKMIAETLIKQGTTQDDILKQYARERKVIGAKWNEFYKVIKLKPNQSAQFFQEDFRKIARDMKVGLSKLDNIDGSAIYRFYSPDRTYSNITVVPVKSLKNGYKK